MSLAPGRGLFSKVHLMERRRLGLMGANYFRLACFCKKRENRRFGSSLWSVCPFFSCLVPSRAPATSKPIHSKPLPLVLSQAESLSSVYDVAIIARRNGSGFREHPRRR
jgi:hypothetical protein